MAQSSDEARPTHNVKPTPLQIAIALAIAKSKPSTLSIREYILKLRKNSSPGRPDLSDPGAHRHLDGCAYWKDLYQKSEANNAALESRVIELERDNDALLIQVRSRQSAAPTTAASSNKRKRGGRTASTSSRPTKQPRIGKGQAPDEVPKAQEDSFAQDFDALEVEAEGSKLVGFIYQVHKLLKPHSMKVQKLAYYLINAATHLASVVTSASNRQLLHQQLATRPTGDVSATFQAAARALCSLLYGLSKLSAAENGAQYQGQVIYAYIQSFAKLLDCIASTSLGRAKLHIATCANTANSAKGKSAAVRKLPKLEKGHDSSHSTTQVLATLIGSLDSRDDAHRQLFEGLLFILLDRIGKRLFTLNFGHERNGTVEGDIANRPEHLGGPAAEPNKEVEICALEIEARYLTPIFECAMAVASKHLGPTPITTTASSTGKAAKGPTKPAGNIRTGRKPALSQHVKEKLQQTLINGMFGDEGCDEFMDCLRMPTRPNSLPALPKVSDDGAADWFKEQIWRLVGWEFLGKEEDW